MTYFTETDVDEYCYGGFVYLRHKPTGCQTRFKEDATADQVQRAWADLQDLVEREL